MTLADARGLALSTDRPASVAGYAQALDLFNSLRTDPVAVLQPVLDEDPDFIAGHLLTAGFMLSGFDAGLLPSARECLAAASGGRRRPNPRERSFQAALQHWADGDMAHANRLLDRHLVDHPRDLFALQLAHMSDLVLGRSQMLRDRIGRVLAQWSEDDAGFGYLLGMQAFGLEECNEYARAEALGLQALERNPHDTWAVHAVAHVYEMQGRVDEGIRWLSTGTSLWQRDNALAVHNFWHLALLHLSNDDPASALAVYDRAIAPGPASMAMDLADASALLWRLGLRGVDVAGRWQSLAARWREQAHWGWSVFNDVHAMLALVGAQEHEAAQAGRRAMAAVPAAAPGPWWAEAGTVCEAVMAFGEGRHAHCAELLLPLLPDAQGYGGSQAQRSLLHLTAMEAARRAGDAALWRGLDSEGSARRPARGRPSAVSCAARSLATA
ncbi:tetratricopeptide repeat protein [Variovorax saccharolyticus]|uniref:tetratricopeptide repeat protein n=1 Tax=Variovorax saccharolyticus TaxID=3053516 RepID=UPI002574AC0D|nr:tetratricopeptide repeat protein [Variovorax sp. J22R187]MDM0019834.1 tetratricopeptide repeat protein [Variovorax sp. J22R187]